MEVTLIHNFHKEAKIRQFTVICDEPEDIGGSNKAPRPTEYLLASLGFCLTSILGIYASVMRVTVDSVKLMLEGFRDDRGLLGIEQTRPGFSRIEVEWHIESREPADKIAKLIKTVEEKCPVTDMIVNSVPIQKRVLLNSRPTGI